MEFRPGLFGGVNSINALTYDEYAQGVVPGEMPASWSMEATNISTTVPDSDFTLPGKPLTY